MINASLLQARSALRQVGHSLWVSIGIVLLGGTAVQAANSVRLAYQGQTEIVPFSDLQAWATTGMPSEDLGSYLATIPLDPELLQTILTEEIPDTGLPLTPSDIEFIAIQLSKLLGDPLQRDRRAAMQTALIESYRGDRTMTILELIQNYPEPEIRVDLARLERVQADANLYIQRVATILRIVEELLPELVCDCPIQPIAPVQVDSPDEPSSTSEAETSELDQSGAPFPCTRVSQFAEPEVLLAAIAPLLPSASPLAQARPDTRLSHPDLWAQGNPQPIVPSAMPQPLQPVPLESDLTSVSTSSENGLGVSQRVVVALGPLRPSFSIRGLNAFAEQGVTSPGWSFYLNVANLNRDDLQTILTTEHAVDWQFLDRNLNTLLGEYLLFQISKVVHTPSGQADIQALRSALVLSAVDDNRVSILEVLQNYPAETVIVEGLNLARLAQNLKSQGAVSTLTSNIEALLVEFQGSVASQVCDCEELARRSVFNSTSP